MQLYNKIFSPFDKSILEDQWQAFFFLLDIPLGWKRTTRTYRVESMPRIQPWAGYLTTGLSLAGGPNTSTFDIHKKHIRHHTTNILIIL